MWNQQPNHVSMWPKYIKNGKPVQKTIKINHHSESVSISVRWSNKLLKIHIKVTHIELNELDRVTNNGWMVQQENTYYTFRGSKQIPSIKFYWIPKWYECNGMNETIDVFNQKIVLYFLVGNLSFINRRSDWNQLWKLALLNWFSIEIIICLMNGKGFCVPFYKDNLHFK